MKLSTVCVCVCVCVCEQNKKAGVTSEDLSGFSEVPVEDDYSSDEDAKAEILALGTQTHTPHTTYHTHPTLKQ
jgi:hypothetical protein